MLKFTSDADLGNILSVAQLLRKKARAIRLNFALPDISSSINGRIRLFYVSWWV